MTINTALLDQVLDHIEAHPDTWRQGAWRCATGMCFAGWAVQLTGGQWATDPTDDPDDLSDAVIADGDDPAEDISLMPDGHTQVVAAFLRARRKLGLRPGQATRLFAGRNTLEDLRRIVADLKAAAALEADQ